jgi:hypothetical protein
MLNKQSRLGLSEQTINLLISRIKKEYGEFVEILIAIIQSKLRVFEKLGASEEEALASVDEWMRSELM